MTLHHRQFGDYATWCYIVENSYGELIIDPGMGAHTWVESICKNPLAILNTHGHFDHTWSNQTLKTKYNIPLVAPIDDLYMIEKDVFNLGLTPSIPDTLIDKEEQDLKIGGFFIKFRHFPGHSPGCSTIEIHTNNENKIMLSGDFIFKSSIGRYDLPRSSEQDMRESLNRFKEIDYDLNIYPGHGAFSTIKTEQGNVPFWLNRLN